jgi:hypothetical protein
MLTPEIIELCKQASVEQDVGRLLSLVSEINQLIDKHSTRFAFVSNPEPEDQSQILKPNPCAEAEPDYTPGIASR